MAGKIFDYTGILTEPAPEIYLARSVFCFSGVFAAGSQEDFCNAARQAGAHVNPQVYPWVDYLVLGKLGNRAVKYKPYGKQAMDALFFNKQAADPALIGQELEFEVWTYTCGVRVAIVGEDQFLAALREIRTRPDLNNHEKCRGERSFEGYCLNQTAYSGPDAIARLLGATPQESSTADFYTKPVPEIVFEGKSFLFTGATVSGSKAFCQEATQKAGGAIARGVTIDLDYLVVGKKGSQDWKYGKYGNKLAAVMQINAAIAQRQPMTRWGWWETEAGEWPEPIAIISEDDWWTALTGEVV